MTFFGLTNPWIIGAYLGCFITVVLCCWIGIRAKDLGEDSED